MRQLITPFMVILYLSLYSQVTFNKIINLNLALNNELKDLEISDEYLYVSSLHLCQNDINENILSQCTAVSKYDYLGNLINERLIDTFAPEGQDRLLVSNEKVLLAGHWHEEFNSRPSILLEFDTILTLKNIDEFPSFDGEIPNNNGIIEFNNSYYLYGTKKRSIENKTYSHIISIDKVTREINWDKMRAHGLWKNNCHDLQPTNDGNLIYIHDFIDDIGAGGESGFQIFKISTSGMALDSFEFEDISIGNPRLLASKEGDIYLSSQDPPYPHQFPSNGRINKINSSLDEIEWSLLLPSNPFIDGHRYKIYDIIQTSNGDIVTCGTVWEEGPDGPLGTPNNHTWNGFIARVTQSGEIRWLKIYRHPNVHPLLPTSNFGCFKPSLLNKIYEATNGSFLVGGTIYYDSYQESALPIDENVSFIWLMMVNNEGCIDGEECTETIILNGVNDIAPNFDIGTTWIYEVEEYPFPVLTTFQKFMITDTTIINSKKVYLIENNYNSTVDQMLVEGEKVYFWDSIADTFRLNFDFGQKDQYVTPWTGVCNIQDTGIAVIRIDSCSSIIINHDTLQIQSVTIENNGSIEENLHTSIYKNIGLKEFGLKLPLGNGLCDFDRGITFLRCFENETENYSFVDYPCDSTWLSTTIDVLENKKEIVYPNPTSGIIFFEGKGVNYKYELYDLTGKIVQKGIISNQKLFIQDKGLFILRFFSGPTSMIIKIAVI